MFDPYLYEVGMIWKSKHVKHAIENTVTQPNDPKFRLLMKVEAEKKYEKYQYQETLSPLKGSP